MKSDEFKFLPDKRSLAEIISSDDLYLVVHHAAGVLDEIDAVSKGITPSQIVDSGIETTLASDYPIGRVIAGKTRGLFSSEIEDLNLNKTYSEDLLDEGYAKIDSYKETSTDLMQAFDAAMHDSTNPDCRITVGYDNRRDYICSTICGRISQVF